MESMAEVKISTVTHIEILRGEMQCEMLRLHEAILAREVQLQVGGRGGQWLEGGG